MFILLLLTLEMRQVATAYSANSQIATVAA